MKKLLLLAIFVLFTSCSKDELVVEPQPQATSVAVCGTVTGVQTFGQVSPPMFIGVRYDMVLDTPYFDGTTTYTKAWFLLNDAQNTYTLQQYWTNPQSVYCGNIPLTNFYN